MLRESYQPTLRLPLELQGYSHTYLLFHIQKQHCHNLASTLKNQFSGYNERKTYFLEVANHIYKLEPCLYDFMGH